VTFGIVVIGVSLGGLRALGELLSGLPEGFPVPVAIAQHRRGGLGDALRHTLQRHSLLEVREPADKEVAQAGRIYLAPADYHMMVEEDRFALSTEGPVQHARPSVDVLFESAADAYGSETIGVVLTGANRDGARGAARIQARGGFIIVQDPLSAERSSMPEAAIAATRADCILPLAQIAPFLVGLVAS
jgi:two-component system chemotaxis response regulator CheB